MKLVPTEKGMGIETKNGICEVLRYSRNFCDETIRNWNRKGYNPSGGSIRFIVAWKNKEDGEEYAVILPDVYFGKM